jgi:hypothetical protein
LVTIAALVRCPPTSSTGQELLLVNIGLGRQCVRELTKMWTLLGGQNSILRGLCDKYKISVHERAMMVPRSWNFSPDQAAMTPPAPPSTIPRPIQLSIQNILLPVDGIVERTATDSYPRTTTTNIPNLDEIYRLLGVQTSDPFPILFDSSELTAFPRTPPSIAATTNGSVSHSTIGSSSTSTTKEVARVQATVPTRHYEWMDHYDIASYSERKINVQ